MTFHGLSSQRSGASLTPPPPPPPPPEPPPSGVSPRLPTLKLERTPARPPARPPPRPQMSDALSDALATLNLNADAARPPATSATASLLLTTLQSSPTSITGSVLGNLLARRGSPVPPPHKRLRQLLLTLPGVESQFSDSEWHFRLSRPGAPPKPWAPAKPRTKPARLPIQPVRRALQGVQKRITRTHVRELGEPLSAFRARCLEACTPQRQTHLRNLLAELHAREEALLQAAEAAFVAADLPKYNEWLLGVGGEEQPSLTKAKEALRGVHINIFDLTADPPRYKVHKSVRKLAQYCYEQKLIFPLALAKELQLRVFLRPLKKHGFQ